MASRAFNIASEREQAYILLSLLPTRFTRFRRFSEMLSAHEWHSPASKNQGNSSPSIEASYDYCEAITKAHYENFPVGSFLIPKPIRPHVYSIYAFARTADDFADEPGLLHEERLKRLDIWEENLDACLSSPKGHIFVALSETIRSHQIPIQLLKDLLKAFRMDVTTSRHMKFEDLLSYCTYSANPVGRLVLHIFGYRQESMMLLSDAICSALQLANFWQDIKIDYLRDRIYLPNEDMQRFGVSENDLKHGRISEGFKSLMEHEIVRTQEFFYKGSPLLDQVKGRLKLELRATYLGGMEILNKIRHSGFDVFNNRPKLSGRDKLKLLVQTLFWQAPIR